MIREKHLAILVEAALRQQTQDGEAFALVGLLCTGGDSRWQRCRRAKRLIRAIGSRVFALDNERRQALITTGEWNSRFHRSMSESAELSKQFFLLNLSVWMHLLTGADQCERGWDALMRLEVTLNPETQAA